MDREKKKTTTIKNKRFAMEIVKNKKTATEAYMLSHQTNNRLSASVSGSRLLARPSVQQEIARQLESIGLTNEYTDQSMQTIIDAAINNAKQSKPADALAAIRMINELKDRFPAKKNINANLNLEQESMNNQTLDELKETMNKLHEENQLILSKLEQG